MISILFPKRHVRVDERSRHAQIDADPVEPREDVIAADEHSDIRHTHVLQTADNCRRQRRVVLRAENRRVVENEAHHAG